MYAYIPTILVKTWHREGKRSSEYCGANKTFIMQIFFEKQLTAFIR